MRQHGWSGIDIGLFQLAGLPALFKFALALPVERMRGTADARTQCYRPWAIALCLLLAMAMAGVTVLAFDSRAQIARQAAH